MLGDDVHQSTSSESSPEHTPSSGSPKTDVSRLPRRWYDPARDIFWEIDPQTSSRVEWKETKVQTLPSLQELKERGFKASIFDEMSAEELEAMGFDRDHSLDLPDYDPSSEFKTSPYSSNTGSEAPPSLDTLDTQSEMQHNGLDRQLRCRVGSIHQDPVFSCSRNKSFLTRHDHDELRHVEEDSKNRNEGRLQILLDRRSDLNLSGKISEISAAQRSLGGYSDIFTGTYILPDGATCKVAIKKLRVHVMDDQNFQKHLTKELYIWSKLDHPRVLPLEGFFLEDNKYPSLVSKWMENGTVLKFLQANPDVELLPMVIGIAEGVNYLHENNIVHSDIKPDNVLISDRGEPLLCDFGVSRMLAASETFRLSSSFTGNLCGTIRYTSTELISSSGGKSTPYSKESDVWAFGMTILTILTGKAPYVYYHIDVQVILALSRGEIPDLPAELFEWPLPKQVVWRICLRCWTSVSERPSMCFILYELKRLQQLITPARAKNAARMDWINYYFFWLQNDPVQGEPSLKPVKVSPEGIQAETRSFTQYTSLSYFQSSNELGSTQN